MASTYYTSPRRGTRYRIDVGPSNYGGQSWEAFEEIYPDCWQKVPCFTRAEERRFPKSLAKAAHQFWKLCGGDT